ncbi:hypothetical protein B0H13DRAFT_2357493 [Mycena leptocephala]|nr:hypothetical protein B0H13DRAFT_2357493 [Mycena leptocephala]
MPRTELSARLLAWRPLVEAHAAGNGKRKRFHVFQSVPFPFRDDVGLHAFGFVLLIDFPASLPPLKFRHCVRVCSRILEVHILTVKL